MKTHLILLDVKVVGCLIEDVVPPVKLELLTDVVPEASTVELQLGLKGLCDASLLPAQTFTCEPNTTISDNSSYFQP